MSSTQNQQTPLGSNQHEEDKISELNLREETNSNSLDQFRDGHDSQVLQIPSLEFYQSQAFHRGIAT